MESLLKAERLRRNLSQARVAEIAGVDTGTVSRWECNQSKPSLEPLCKLCDFFGMTAKELGFDGDRMLPQNLSFKLLAQEPVTRLLTLTSLSANSHYAGTHLLVRQISEEIMSDPTRRDLLEGILSTLVALPISSIQNGAHWETILQQCTIAIAACEELSKSNDAVGLTLAFNSVSAYLEITDKIAHESLHLRKKALNLATNCAILKTELGWSHKDLLVVIQYARKAVEYGTEYYKETGNISILLSARSKLAWAYYDCYGSKNTLALNTALQSVSLLNQKNTKTHPCIIGGTYSTLALMQADQGLDTDMALGRATELDPGDEPVAMMDFTRARLPLEKALILCHQDNCEQARKTVEEQINPDTLTQKSSGSGWGRLEAIYLLTLSSLKSKERDMDEVIRFWIAGVEGAKAARSKYRFAQSSNLYQQMKIAWPGEHALKELRDYLVPW